jgi:hypothetical protein
MRIRNPNIDVTAGVLLVAFGGWFCAGALLNLPFGNAFRMGAGFFPTVVGALLLMFGLVIIAIGWRNAGETLDLKSISWRAVVLFPVALILFGLAIRPLGLVIALLILCLCSSFAIRQVRPAQGALMSVAITALSVLIFSFGLGLNLPLVGDWLR